jgi:bifunctional UDP-N-acetylglucosamine pyrophosphorylase/glucosamine-1-phosphate N-acetyltransferase
MDNLAVIILAAGMGKRMRSDLVKVLHPLLGKPMLSYPLELTLEHLQPEKTIVVVGHQAEQIQDAFSDPRITFVRQKDQLGTGHAVSMTEPLLGNFKGCALILCGDIPLITAHTLTELATRHRTKKASLTLLTTHREDPTGYGRIIHGALGKVHKVVEEKDASSKEREIKEVNTGIYCVQARFLFQALAKVRSQNAQGEYYLPDIVELAHHKKKRINIFSAPSPTEVMGINTRAELAQAEGILAERVRQHWMAEGITIQDPGSVFIEPSVSIGKDTVLYPNCYLRGETSIGEGCRIGPQVEISDSQIGNGVQIRFCTVITESTIEGGAIVGPFSHLRPHCHLEQGAKIGNFVEVKKSRIGQGTKANHLSYIGDSEVGKGVNIGAGTITCNYDGFHKHRTVIEDEVFVGSNTALVAPVTVGRGAVVGAGATITKDVPPYALAVGRAKQKGIKRWVTKRDRKRQKESDEDV